ncbi:MAG: hypothetical protein LBP83_04195 [Dysgonamonadaceae bacterium]|jgi:hypothetical protein|nr:hypothetical protein [Dysgonamonadaceae bacterium]
MNNRKIFIYLAFVILSGCKGYNSNEPHTIIPQIQYEFSGGAGHYNYAPSIIQDEYGIRYGFICENRDPFQIVDYVYLYKGIPTKEGYQWQPGTMIVAPSVFGWDNCHICDPDVRQFRTTYNSETYDWIMTYLGVDQWDCKHNQIGLAISKNIEGPYIKFDKNPLIAYEGRDKWGVGQSTTVVLDSTTIRLFYSNSNGGFTYRDIQLNKLSDIRMGEEQKIPQMGANNYPAYSQKNVYMVSERRVSMDTLIPSWVGNVSELTYIPVEQDLSTPGDQWIKIGQVGPAESGFPRNHNPGILTDTRGYMLNDDELIMYFTPAVTGEDWLWSYDLYSARFDLKKFFNN